jgi:E-phenylitaconyl-CoA hydratase
MIHVKEEPPVLTVTFDKPGKLNAYGHQDGKDLAEVWAMMAQRDDLLVAIITGAGDKSFIAGVDLSELGNITDVVGTFWHKPDRGYGHGLESGLRLWKPVIAAINGYCVGQGLVVALGADIRLCSDNATFSMPEVKIGVNTAVGSSLLASQIGWSNAADMCLACTVYTAEDALRTGLVSRVYPQADLMPAARAMAERIASYSPLAVQATKEVMVRSRDMTLEQAQTLGEALRLYIKGSADFSEGFAAMAEKRAPAFKGR